MAVVVKLVALLGFAFMFVWTLVTGREEVPLTERSQVVAVSEEEAAALGAQAFAEVLGRFEPVRSGLELEATSSRTRRRGSSFAHSRFSNKKRRRPPPTVLCDSSEAISSRRGGSRRSGRARLGDDGRAGRQSRYPTDFPA